MMRILLLLGIMIGDDRVVEEESGLAALPLSSSEATIEPESEKSAAAGSQ